jgi:hypothetical protein
VQELIANSFPIQKENERKEIPFQCKTSTVRSPPNQMQPSREKYREKESGDLIQVLENK